MIAFGQTVIRHALALVFSLPVLVLAWLVFNPWLSHLISPRLAEMIQYGRPALGSFTIGCYALTWVGMLLPLTVWGEQRVMRRGWGWRRHVPLMAGLFLACSLVAWLLVFFSLILGDAGNQLLLLLVGLDNMLWGTAYWIILRASAGWIGRPLAESVK